MSANLEDHGIVLVCDGDGAVERVVRNDFGLSVRVDAGSQVSDLVDLSGREKIGGFLAELQARQAAYDWEITVMIDGVLLPLHFAGARFEDAYLVMAARSRNGLTHLNEEVMRINNEQTNLLRATAKDLSLAVAKGTEGDYAVYGELSRLNNEMANLQRELAKKNAELARYYYDAEEEQLVASHLMNRLVRTDMLRDPLLNYWIQPAHNLSGDLIAAARTPGGVLHVLLADGTGHGLTASLNVLPVIDPFYAMTAKGLGVAAIAREINGKVKRWLPVGRFVAAALIAFDSSQSMIEVWCGGVPPPFLLDAGGRMLHEFANMHLAFGVLSEGEFDARTELLKLDAPGQLIMCSDGATEAEGADGTLFGRERLLRTLHGATAVERLDRLKDDLALHFGKRSAIDDISVAIVDCVRRPLAQEDLARTADLFDSGR